MRASPRIAVVVPCYNEARLIGRMLSRLPSFVDDVVVVDDASPDQTSEVVRARAETRTQLVRHPQNLGVGAAIASGYERACQLGAELIVVMAGDDQMDPEDLPQLLGPLLAGRADYVKGNRFVHHERHSMPRLRRLGSAVLAWWTRALTGLRVDDTQCGYTAITASMLRRLDLGSLWPRYGYPNDLLGMLATQRARIVEVPVRPVYADERSGLRPWHVLQIAGVALRRRWLERRAPSPLETSELRPMEP